MYTRKICSQHLLTCGHHKVFPYDILKFYENVTIAQTVNARSNTCIIAKLTMTLQI